MVKLSPRNIQTIVPTPADPIPPSFPVRVVLGQVKGALQGYGGYWLFRVIEKYNIFSIDAPLNPKAFVFMSMGIEATVNLLELIEKIANKIIGKREDYTSNEKNPSPTGLRVRIWKLIQATEGLANKIDQVGSNLFKIRSLETLKRNNIIPLNMTIFEVYRKFIIEGFTETIQQEISFRGGLKIVNYCGLAIPGAGMLLSLTILGFIVVVQSKVNDVYFAKAEAEDKEQEELMERQVERLQQLNGLFLKNGEAELRNIDY